MEAERLLNHAGQEDRSVQFLDARPKPLGGPLEEVAVKITQGWAQGADEVLGLPKPRMSSIIA